jgi:hypothetical protein
MQEQYHQGEPDMNEEKKNWLSLPEQTRSRIIDFINGEIVDWTENERAELQRNLRWNMIYLRKLIEKEQEENATEPAAVERMKNLLTMYENAERRVEMKVLENELHRKQEN